MKRMLLGVGNILSRDDGAGPTVARSLSEAPGWIAIDCGTSLENACGWVVRERPDLLVIVDAARMGLNPGSVRRLPLAERDRMLASTHGLPVSFVWERMLAAVRTGIMIGIEPGDLGFGEGLSESVSRATRWVALRLGAGDLDAFAPYQPEGPRG